MIRVRMAFLGSVMAMSMIGAAPVTAQQPTFRVPMGNSRAVSSSPPVYAWLESISECSSTCGNGDRTTSFQCQNAADFEYSGGGYGAPEADAFCTAAVGPKPASSTSSCTNYSGCGYDWVNPPIKKTPVRIATNPIGRIGCGNVRTEFSPYCQRTGGTTPIVMAAPDHRFCRNDTPDYNKVAAGDPDALGYDRTLPEYDACAPIDHEWRTGAYGSFDSACSTTAKQTRTVICYRKFDNAAVADSACDAASKPTATNVEPIYTSCTFDWINGGDANWTAWSSTCSNSANRTRNPQCRRSNGDIVADASCTGAGKPKPSTSETQGVYTGCTYTAGGTTTYGSWNSQCSANAQRSVTRQCLRSNGDVVSDSECTSRGTAVTTTQSQAVYDQCTYRFDEGAWSDWNSHCSPSASRTRSITCRRSDGTAVSDAECTNRGLARGSSSETQALYDQCSYVPRDRGRTACSMQGQAQQYWDCTRQDGVTGFAASMCGKSNPETVSCPIPYTYAPHSHGTGACENNLRPHYYDCMRSDGQDGFPAGQCGKSNPEMESCTPTTPTYSYTPHSHGVGACDNGVRPHYWDCMRNDGQDGYPASNCGKSNPQMETCTPTEPTYSYTPHSHGYGACDANNTRPHYWDCMRNDGQDGFAPGNCGKSNPEMESCTFVSYAWSVGGWSDWNSHCSGSATRTRAVWCRGTDGSTGADSQCTGTRPASSETTGVYDQCGFSRGSETGVSNWSSHCSGSATRTHYYNCRRADGAVVTDAECTNRGIGLTSSETSAVYDQCGYATVNWTAFSDCSNGSQTRTGQCQRSDGAIVANSECDNRGQATSQTQACQSGPVYGAYCLNSTKSGGVNWGSMYPGYQKRRNECFAAGGTCYQVTEVVPMYSTNRAGTSDFCHYGPNTAVTGSPGDPGNPNGDLVDEYWSNTAELKPR